MYKALNYWVFGGFAGERTAEEFIDFAAAQKLDGVELTVGDLLAPDVGETRCRAIRDYAAAKGVGLRSVATGFYWNHSLGAADAAERAAAIDFTRRYLQIAAWLGAGVALVVPGAACVPWDASRPAVPYGEVWANSTASLREVLPDAERLRVDVALENVWGRFLFSPMEWKLYLDQFASPRVGMYFDVGNCCLYARPEDYPPVLGTRIKAVHLKNWRGDDCGGGLHGFGDDLLDGEVDFPALFAALTAVNYSGPFTVEMIPFSRLPDLTLPDPALAAATAVKLRGL